SLSRLCSHLLHLSSFFFSCYGLSPPLHSFPTRRSSDLTAERLEELHLDPLVVADASSRLLDRERTGQLPAIPRCEGRPRLQVDRSEEHTSELQSRENLVCRLLLEKKKKNKKHKQYKKII